MKTLIAGALGACLLLPIGAGAQADPAHIPPIGVFPEPRFKLEALRFKAIDEQGLGVWPLSDEVKVVIFIPTPNVPLDSVQTVTKKFGDVDAGETRDIPLDQSCILPIAGLSASRPNELRGDLGDAWSCSAGGAPGPFSFTVELREIDEWKCRITGWAGCDLIGRHEVVYSMEELIALQVGQVLEESVLLSPDCPPGIDPCGDWDWPVYQFTWRLTRLSDAEPVVGPISRLPDDAEPELGPSPF
jgi:hypothetical protein